MITGGRSGGGSTPDKITCVSCGAGAAPTNKFCGECGASLFYEPHDSGALSIAAGMFDQPNCLRSMGHIYVDHKSDYYEIADGLPQFGDSSEGQLEGGVFLKSAIHSQA